MNNPIKTDSILKGALLILLLVPLFAHGQVSKKHVLKISRYIEKFSCHSDTLIDSMGTGNWRDIEVLSRLSDLTHEAYLHAFYISGMLDVLTKTKDKNKRTTAVFITTFYIKAAIRFMKISNKILIIQLDSTENPTIVSLGMTLKQDAEKFMAELETVKNELEYDYTHNVESFSH